MKNKPQPQVRLEGFFFYFGTLTGRVYGHASFNDGESAHPGRPVSIEINPDGKSAIWHSKRTIWHLSKPVHPDCWEALQRIATEIPVEA